MGLKQPAFYNFMSPQTSNRHSLLFILILISSISYSQKIGFLLDDYTSKRWLEDSAAFSNEVIDLGGKPIIKSCNNDPELQHKQARKMILKDKVKVLVIVASDKNKNSEIIDFARKKGVKTILYSRFIMGGGDYYVSFDGEDIGRMQAQYLLDNMKGKNIVLINGPVIDYNAILLREGQMEVLEDYIERGEINLIFSEHMNSWHREGSFGVMVDLLTTHKDSIDGILCANDELATGVIEAMESFGADFNFPITGQDGMKQALKLIIEKKQSMTILKSVIELAQAAAQLSISLARDEKPTIPLQKNYIMDSEILSFKKEAVVVDLDNIYEFITVEK